MVNSLRAAHAFLEIRLIPRSKQDEFAGWMDDGRLKVRVKAPPVDGKANQSMIKFLAAKIGIKKGQIEITSGHSSRNKRLTIAGLSQAELDQIIKKI